ncbi:MAG: Rab family GTPase [Promethearchaeota archaeon]
MSGPVVHVRDRRDKKAIPAKVIIVGDPAVGKTSLIQQYVHTRIDDEYMPTVGAHISKQPVQLNVNGNKVDVNLMIWDLAGQEQFRIVRKVYYNGVRGVILVFDLSRGATLDRITEWHGELLEHGLGGVAKVLVGNKSDLVDERAVTRDQVEAMQGSTGIRDYVETSALNGDNVNEMFYRLAELVFLGDKARG